MNRVPILSVDEMIRNDRRGRGSLTSERSPGELYIDTRGSQLAGVGPDEQGSALRQPLAAPSGE